MAKKVSAEETVRTIRRKTKRQYNAVSSIYKASLLPCRIGRGLHCIAASGVRITEETITF